jgi:ribosome modulation factor
MDREMTVAEAVKRAAEVQWQERYEIGRRAAQVGKGEDACPYKSADARGAWLTGWKSIRG